MFNRKRALTKQHSSKNPGDKNSMYTYDYEYYEYDDETENDPQFKLINPSELDETFKNQKIEGHILKSLED